MEGVKIEALSKGETEEKRADGRRGRLISNAD